MPSEDVLFSITSHHPALLARAMPTLLASGILPGFGGSAESQTEIIGGGFSLQAWPELLWSFRVS
jgi:hypothetical protein